MPMMLDVASKSDINPYLLRRVIERVTGSPMSDRRTEQELGSVKRGVVDQAQSCEATGLMTRDLSTVRVRPGYTDQRNDTRPRS